MKVRVICPVYPTEDDRVVSDAISSLIIGAKPTLRNDGLPRELYFEGEGMDLLAELRSMIHNLRIIDTVKSRLILNWNGQESFILLDKQAATIKRLRLVDDSEETPPLGSIMVKLEFTSRLEFESVLSWLTPRTEDGRIVAD
ncbi:MAG: RNA-binding domain-containing protein [Candidatus Thorarchaeota archaeon]